MKKILSLFVFSTLIFILVGCQEKLGDFPEVKESQKVEMTAEEVSLLMADVNLEEQIDQVMMLSIDLDIQATNAVYDWFDFLNEEKLGDQTIDLNLSSKTYFSLSDQIDEVVLHAQNTIDLLTETIYIDGVNEDERLEVVGDVNVYFTNQFLYYDSDVTGLDENEFLKNGQYKLNYGITQTMWDELYQDMDIPSELDIAINPQELLTNGDMMALMLEADMLSVYKSGSEYTFIVEINKENVIENYKAILDVFMDTEAFTQDDYDMYKAEIEAMINDFSELEILFGVVVENNLVKKIGVDLNVSYADDEMTFNIIGKLVFDMAVDMPKLPEDLDEYELIDMN